MIRRASPLLLAFVLLLTSTADLVHAAAVAPAASQLRAIVETLTTPEMEGRRAGTPGGDRATRQIAEWLASAGLRPGGDAGSFLQSFTVAPGRRLGNHNALEIGTRTLTVGTDWTPHGGSERGEVRGDVVFVDDTWSGELRDKIVVAAPRGSRLESLILARQRGAAAVLLIADTLPTLDATAARVGIVSGSVTRAAADALRTATPAGSARVTVDLVPTDIRAANVIGILPGNDPMVAADAIVLGAHWDHLGSSGGAVYPGADDNASGTAVVTALARAFAAAGGVRHTLVFVLFGAEELGLIGSGHYVGHPAVPLSQTVAMLNFDMVGRMRDGTLTIGGVDSGDRLRVVTEDAARVVGVRTDLRGTPFSPSDHTRFYAAGTPVLFFHTGGHDDYHRPGDTTDRLNTDGMARVAALAISLVSELDGGARPVYAKLSPPARSRRGSGSGSGAFLGVGGDGPGGDGAHLAHVVAGSAAERAGLRDGDVLVRVDDVAVDGFEALRRLITAHHPGDTVRLVYLRDGRDYETSATLERSRQ
jgi:hypothetical protein